MFLLIFITILISGCSYCLDEGYYWREYFGTVPSDAVIAGKDMDTQNVYIGQGYVKDTGLIVGQITPGVQQMSVPYSGVKKSSKYIKILCGTQENFYWLQANSTNLHLKILDQQPVIGGHSDVNDYYSIGRISKSGDTKVGKIASFWIGGATFYFVDGATEKVVTSYEVLMYKNKG